MGKQSTAETKNTDEKQKNPPFELGVASNLPCMLFFFFFAVPITDTVLIILGELQIGVLKDSAAFRDAVNLAANITSEPHLGQH